MISTEIKEFKRIFNFLSNDIEKFKRSLANSTLEISSKKLLQAFFHYRKNNREQMFKILKSSPLTNEFMEGVRLYLLGMAHNHYGNYHFASEHLEKSVKIFTKINDEEFKIFSISVLILSYANQRKIEEMESHTKTMKGMIPNSNHSHFLMTHAEAVSLYYSFQHEQLHKLLEKTLSSRLNKLELFKPSFLILQFSLFFNEKKYEQCQETLEEYKKSKGFTVKANYSYMKTLLDHISEDKPLYIYENQLKEYSELRDQLATIKYLARKELAKAEEYWKRLSKHNPKLYQPNFNFAGDYCLFSHALQRHLPSAVSVSAEELKHYRRPMHRLEYILQKMNGTSIEKELLIKLIWEEEMNEFNQNRLRKLVHEFKKKHGKEVKTSQGSYRIPKAA